jgi:hypothetical protein
MTVRIVSDIESKTKRGYRQVLGCGITGPSDGMIEFRFNTGEDGYALLWMTCAEARTFCKMLDDSLLYHEEFGGQNAYVHVDRTVPGYNPNDYMNLQLQQKTGEVTKTFICG